MGDEQYNGKTRDIMVSALKEASKPIAGSGVIVRYSTQYVILRAGVGAFALPAIEVNSPDFVIDDFHVLSAVSPRLSLFAFIHHKPHKLFQNGLPDEVTGTRPASMKLDGRVDADIMNDILGHRKTVGGTGFF